MTYHYVNPHGYRRSVVASDLRGPAGRGWKPIPLACVTFCSDGHATAPAYPLVGNWARPVGIDDQPKCIRYTLQDVSNRDNRVECGAPTIYLIDYPEAVSAWFLGGDEAALEVLRELRVWRP